MSMGHSCYLPKWCWMVALVATSLVISFPARAASFDDYRALYYGSSLLVGVACVVPMGGNYYEMSRKSKGSRGWLISGYVLGAVATGMGAAAMYLGARKGTDSQGNSVRTHPEAIYWGVTPLAIGAATLVGTLLNQFLPRNPKLSIAPALFQVPGHPTYYGVSVTWLGW